MPLSLPPYPFTFVYRTLVSSLRQPAVIPPTPQPRLQDAGFLATTAGGAPFVMSKPWVLPDLPLVFQSLHETVDQIVTEPFLRNWIDTMCIFCGFPAKGAMTAHILYILDRFFEDSAKYCVPLGGTEEIAKTMVRSYSSI